MKRKTKAQREAAEYAALLQRIRDIYSGACGCAWDSDYQFAVAEDLSRALPVIRDVFGLVRDDGIIDHRIALSNIDEYDTPERAASFLYKHGVRA